MRCWWGDGAISYSEVREIAGSSVNSLPGDPLLSGGGDRAASPGTPLLGGGGERAARLGRIPHAAGLGAGILAAALRSRARDEACVGACLRLLSELQLVRLDLKHTKIRFKRKKELSMLSCCNIIISNDGYVGIAL